MKFQFVAHPLSQQLLKMEWQKGDASYLSTANFNGWFYAFLRVLVLPLLVPFSFLQFLVSNESIKKVYARLGTIARWYHYHKQKHITINC